MKRIFVERKDGFNVETKNLIGKITETLKLDIKSLRTLNIYDIDGLDDKAFELSVKNVFSETNVDVVYKEIELGNHFATELLPAQFDQRADAAIQIIKLLIPGAQPVVNTGKLFMFDDSVTEEQKSLIKKIVINKIEVREKDLLTLGRGKSNETVEIETMTGFINLNEDELKAFYADGSWAMKYEDLAHIQKYFKSENRDPRKVEVLLLDTYWSDHCRHTTFETEIKDVQIKESPLKVDIEKALKDFDDARIKLRPNKPRTLMNLATINFKELLDQNKYQDVERSAEINACSVFHDVDINGKDVKYLIQFKNETHNHPTEIEPFGGAATCLGGAIRDPLSGRSYVYQGMRVSGSGNPIERFEDTLPNKLPQATISKMAAEGFSSYGNQIGLATTLVEEIVHEGFKAKRLEAGAVVAASPAINVRREEPIEGDVIILMGGGTGRDGIGGATGSSKKHNSESVQTASSEVQKGNAPEERKLQRLFSKYAFSSLVKKSNDFGAGGVSTALGELADSIEVNLDKVPLKYKGMNGQEIALSESQERMSVIVAKEDSAKVLQLAEEENIEAVEVAKVTNTNRLIMKHKGKVIIDIAREFLETNGVRQEAKAIIESQTLFEREVEGSTPKERFLNNLSDINVASQKGLTQMFDSTIGASTVLHPYGGKTQLTKAHASIQKVPMRQGDKTNTVTILTSAYNPKVTVASPFLGGNYAIVAAISKVVAYGGNVDSVKFSLQEFFEKLGEDDSKWGKPLAALLGASNAMREFEKAAIGGKDSMSGTFNDINVPPTLIAFALSIAKADNIISSEFKEEGNDIYVLKHDPKENGLPNFNQLKENYKELEKLISSKEVISAWPLVKGGIAEAVVQMAMGNDFGFKVNTKFDIYDFNYGTIVVEAKGGLPSQFTKVGKVTNGEYEINDVKVSRKDALDAWEKPLEKLFPLDVNLDKGDIEDVEFGAIEVTKPRTIKEKPLVVIPVFPGTNCEFDLERKFDREGAEVIQYVFNNQSEDKIAKSIKELSELIAKSDILALAGGFSAGDEPDGSGKFIANILKNESIKAEVTNLRTRKGLIIGICNGFQALVKSGLLPYGEVKDLEEDSPTLFRNDIDEHVARYVTTKVTNNSSPWTWSFKQGQQHSIAVSHGEGKFVANEEWVNKLIKNGQVAFQYSNNEGKATMNGKYNPNGSTFAIEGILSEDGLILGKMGHSERYEENIAKNISGDKDQNIFRNAVCYFKGEM